MSTATTTPAGDGLAASQERLRGRRLALVVAVGILSVLPGALTLLGIDFDQRALGVFRGTYTHTLLEWSAFGAALYSVLLALVHYRVKGDLVSPLICMGLFAAGCMDLLHAVFTDRLLVEGSGDPNFMSVSWSVSRTVHVLTLLVGVSLLLPRGPERGGSVRPWLVGVLTAVLGLAGATLIWVCARSAQLPSMVVAGAVIPRPWDMIPLALFALAGLVLYPLFHQRQRNAFSLSLWLSALPAVATQIHMALGAQADFDHHFVMAHLAKIVSYAVPGMGLLLDYVELYQRETHLHSEMQARSEEASLLLEGTHDAIFAVDEQGRVVRWNSRAHDLFGWSAEEIFGRRIDGFGAADPAGTGLVELLPGFRSAAAASEEVVEWNARRWGGELFPVDLVVVPTAVERNPRVTVFVRDASERKRIAQQAVQSEKLSAMGMLVAGVAHELNNPLQVVVGYAQLLKQQCQGDSELVARLGRIEEGAERAREIVSNLTTFARQHEPRRALVELNRIARSAVEWAQKAADDAEVELEVTLANGLPPIWADRHQLAQVLVNLLVNASHALERREEDAPGTRRIRLTTRAPRAGWVEVSIEDNGPGIPADQKNRIFDPFFTTKEVGEGTGLGLSIAFGMVEQHGGHIWVAEAQPAPGARFVIELPVADPDDRDVPTAPPAAEPLEAAAERQVLIVDDDTHVLRFLGEVLEGAGYQVDAVTSGEEAIERIDAKRYDLVLCDLRMPGVDGRQVYEHLVAIDPTAGRRFAFVTGDTLTGGSRTFLARVEARTLEKPCTVESILATAREILEPSS